MPLARCCYCGEIATGRYCFLNADERVVDNCFCPQHNTEVFRQTKKSLEVIHRSSSISRQYMIVERWDKAEGPPELPKNKQALLAKGAIYMH